MNENLFFQEQNISNQLIQTFGRKPPNKYDQQYHFRQCEQQQKNMKGVIYYQNDSPLMTFRQNDYSQSKRNHHILATQQRGQKQQSSRRQLESIDRINKKINGLIKSISASCEKKINSNENRHQHEAYAKKRLIFEDPVIQRDRQQTEKKLYPFEKINIKPHFLQFKEKQKYYEIPAHEQESSHLYEQENFDSLDERIKRISCKIDEHQKKRQKQTTDRYQKLQHQLSYKHLKNDKNLKSQRDLRVNQSFNNKYVDLTLKKQKNTVKEYENRTNNFIDINKQNRVNKKQKLIVQAKQLLFKKGGYFKQKYQELKMAGKQEWMKLQQNDKIMNQATRLKTNNSQKETNTKDYKLQNVKQQQQIPNRPMKNTELLSYKTTFLKQIIKQIQLDQDFRHAKHMFGGIDNLFDENNHNSKWTLLQAELKRQGFSLAIREVKEIFMPRDDQIDPFMSVNHSHQQLIHGVIYAYQTTERHWHQSIYHNWTLWQLKEAKLTSQYLDRDHKGYITVEDLTVYVNTEVDGYFRNRDLLLIFHRLSDNRSHIRKQSNNGIKFKQIMTRLLSL